MKIVCGVVCYADSLLFKCPVLIKKDLFEASPTHYVQLSEWVEVDFPMLENPITDEVIERAKEQEIKKLIKEHEEKLKRMEDRYKPFYKEE